ncbi:MAG: sulfatase, partial [Planctomycetota bacterium]
MSSRQPNLLFIFTDEQRADTMGAYGNRVIRTPNLDRLASGGVVFERAYVTQSVCTPSRASIMTGLYPHNHGCLHNNIPLPEGVPTLVELADFSDYTTCYNGKWHLGDEVFCQHGFDQWISIEDAYRGYYSARRDRDTHSSYHHWLVDHGLTPPRVGHDGFDGWSRGDAAALPERFCKPTFQAERAEAFLRDNRDNPFVLYVNFLEPHMPFTGPRDDMYGRDEVELPSTLNRRPDERTPLRARAFPYMPHFRKFLPGEPTEAQWRDLVARYWGLVSQVDTAVGRILSTLAECGLEENTIVVFTSDHGDMMGNHGLVTKCQQYEEAVRVPLLMRGPGIRLGRIAEPVGQVDLVPTLLE